MDLRSPRVSLRVQSMGEWFLPLAIGGRMTNIAVFEEDGQGKKIHKS